MVNDTSTTSHWLEKLVTVGLIAVILTAPTQHGFTVFGQVHVCVADILLLFVALIWGVSTLRFGIRNLLSVRKPPLIIWLFIGLAVLSLFDAADKFLAIKELIQWIAYFLVAYILFANPPAWLRGTRRLTYLFLGVSVVVVAISVIQYAVLSIPPLEVGGPFRNRNVLGGYFAMVLPVMFALMLYDERLTFRVLWGGVVAAGLLVTLSAASFLAMITAFIGISALKSQRALVICVAVIFVAVLPLLGTLPRSNIERLQESIAIFEADGKAAKRYAEWQAAVHMIEKHPVIGVGPGNYQNRIGRHYGILPSAAKKTAPDSQNLYLVLGSTVGLPALLCFVGILALFISGGIRGWTLAESGVEKGLLLGVAAGLFGFALNSFWAPLLVRGIGIPLAFMVTLAASGRSTPFGGCSDEDAAEDESS